ncbi:Nacht domain-containing protein [Fusarium pseudocircinatum]|uniref:Nacht domain-containing protein n=1 Tax=Fusarium pseudocircinatum TaxID=56676 RepID=A0A8H5KKB9_9HYPO|nr:Nacht domain-containing protein [Fusarium pseudocircinatum]
MSLARTLTSDIANVADIADINDGSFPAHVADFPALVSNLLTRSRRGPYADWYLGNPRGRWSDPAKCAYQSAIETFEKELSLDKCDKIWLRGQSSMKDVEDALSTAQNEYLNRSEGSHVRKWLSSCSSRVTHYGTVFDVFVQHHPEYVSLAWGTFKFLFVAIMNYEELLIQIAKAVSRIADVLPRTDLHLTLYPTD